MKRESTNSANPSTYIGGTWQAYGSGRVTIGSGSCTDVELTTKSFTANATGGVYMHSHKYGIRLGEYYGSNHIESLLNQLGGNKTNWNTPCNVGNVNLLHTSTASSGTSSIIREEVVAMVGYNSNHLPMPYIVVYRWRRTA